MGPLRSLLIAIGGGDPIGRKTYVLAGLLLALLKYLVEYVVITTATGGPYTPADFISPSLTDRNDALRGGPEWLGMAWMLWTLPFIWVALTLSVRRSADSGNTPWLGLCVLVPYVNLSAILVFALLPSRPGSGLPRRPPTDGPDAKEAPAGGETEALVWSAGVALVVGALYAIVVIGVAVQVFGDYGVSVFYGCPVVVGATVGYLLNRDRQQSLAYTNAHALWVVGVVMAVMLLVGWEGAICLAMAAPIMLPMTIAGAIAGLKIAGMSHGGRDRGMAGALMALPLLGLIAPGPGDAPELSVETAVVIEAPPREVWDMVIAFPPIEAPESWLFRLGIASPRSAWIEGHGVGAVRRCVFSTGEFVEPITAWEAPRLLAFDVAEQPEPMFELTPYQEIHPPHLDGALRSTRGEFRLEAIEGGRTRLVGRTWYRLEMAPSVYWTAWTDWVLHQIHRRVLVHIKSECEKRA